ncbi:MAG TPA: HEPN/Toprim-associated domain-containing protein [Rhizomicrobium sp.]|nr:HEPN/Toprim-associated domain-containing protein [Rhizomicrobium sp.]
MGSYCAIVVEGRDLASAKSAVPDQFVSLFQEGDRHDVYEEKYESTAITYRASRDVILQRLDLLGVTSEAARASFEHWLQSERSNLQEYSEDGDAELYEPKLKLLQEFSYDEWRRRAKWALQNRYESDRTPPDAISAEMAESQDGWFHWPSGDDRLLLRAYLDAVPEVSEVSLDISALAQGGYIDDENFIETSRAMASAIRREIESAVVIGEGVSDTRILQASLQGLFPEVANYFSFFDHSELSVDGGAFYLVKFLKAFATARIPTQLIAVFDNDVAGSDAFAEAVKLKLPANITPIRLPEIEIARNYPTLGAQGAHNVDVNGQAASIELYLGRHNLVAGNGDLRPVRFGGSRSRQGGYQGEVDGKAECEIAPNIDPTRKV